MLRRVRVEKTDHRDDPTLNGKKFLVFEFFKVEVNNNKKNATTQSRIRLWVRGICRLKLLDFNES
jgi:hypothetical protein